jgi:hypothetical protein
LSKRAAVGIDFGKESSVEIEVVKAGSSWNKNEKNSLFPWQLELRIE